MKIYLCYILILFLFNSLILITPYLASIGHPISDNLYSGFSYICHQLIPRSLCLFKNTSYHVAGCVPHVGYFVYSKEKTIMKEGTVGYKFPVCARDQAFYLAALIGGVVFPFFSKINSKKIPNLLFFILAITPLAIDASGQLFGFWESTNLVRIITGIIAGFVFPFYFFPVANTIIEKLKNRK